MGPNNLKTAKVAQVTVGLLLVVAQLATASNAQAQSKQYQRKAPAAEQPVGAGIPPKAGAPAAKGAKDAKAPAAGTAATDAPKAETDKLDISELEQKYWAPKDTDFSVVQNRTYTKAKRFALTPTYGTAVNNTFSSGNFYGIAANYYFSERTGVEFNYMKADLTDSDATKKFKSGLSGGGVAPDFNREKEYMSIGYNFVPFYAKMSFMGSKIIYFDMQITPTIGLTKYEQQAQTGGKSENAFTYGLDITQYFFFHKNFAVRANLHNQWSSQDEVSFKTGTSIGSDTYNDTSFTIGLTWFIGQPK